MSQNNSTIEQEFTYRTNRYAPQAPIAGFVNFLSKHFYSEADEVVVETVRRSMAEFTNDENLRMAVSVFSNKQVASEKVVMNEQYTAKLQHDSNVHMFSVCIVSADEITKDVFKPCPSASLHETSRASERFYEAVLVNVGGGLAAAVPPLSVQYVSIYHQLQNLVRTLSDKLKFYFSYDQAKQVYYLLGRPLDQAANEKDRFQVLIRLNIPAVSVSLNDKQAA